MVIHPKVFFVLCKSSVNSVITALGGSAVVPESVRVGVATGVYVLGLIMEVSSNASSLRSLKY